MLCPRRKFLKVVGAIAAFPVMPRAQATSCWISERYLFQLSIFYLSLVQSSPIKLACPGPTSSNGSVPVFGPIACPGTQPPMVQTSQLWREY